MPDESPPPRRWTEGKALIVSLLIIVILVVLYFFVTLPPAPQKLPTSQAPGSNAPAKVETPEEAKPPAQRESD